MRVFRSGGLTKDAVYLRGLHELVGPPRRRAAARPALARQDAARRGARSSRTCTGAACSPIRSCVPRYLDHPGARAAPRRHPPRSTSLASLVGGTTMKIGFVVNSIATEKPEYTTVRLALAAARAGPRDLADGRRRLLPPRRRHRRRARSHARREQEAHVAEPRSSTASRTTEHGCEDDRDRRPRRADDAQRPGRRHDRTTVGGHLGRPVRAALASPRARSS